MTAQTTTATAPSTPSLAITTQHKPRQSGNNKNTPSLAITAPHKPRQSGNKKHAKPGYHDTTQTTPIRQQKTRQAWLSPHHPHVLRLLYPNWGQHYPPHLLILELPTSP
jgi:hypothetical protein